MFEYDPDPPESDQPVHQTQVVATTPFDGNAARDVALGAIGAGAVTVVVATGVIFCVAGALKLVTWALGGIAGILTAAAPWIAVILGVAAYSAFTK